MIAERAKDLGINKCGKKLPAQSTGPRAVRASRDPITFVRFLATAHNGHCDRRQRATMSAAAGAASGSSAMERPGRAARRPGSGKPGRERSRDRPFFFKTAFRNTIYHMLRERPGWRVTDSDMDWDLHWAERDWMFEVFDTIHLSAWQRVNHFRNDRELCRKDLLIKNVKRHRRDLEKMGRREEAALFDFCPKTFVLPGARARACAWATARVL